MDVILLERVEKLGQMGDVVSVKPGYARNFLLPQKKALRATKENKAGFEARRVQLEAENLKQRQEAEDVAGRVDGLVVTLVRQAGESGQLYGSVTARDIAAAAKEGGVTVGRDQVVITDKIKSLGLFDVRLALHPEVAVGIRVNVARSLEEADMQLKAGGMIIARDDDDDEDEDEDLDGFEDGDDTAEEAGDAGADPEEQTRA